MNKKTKKTSFLARAAMTLFLAVLTTTTAWADTWPEYITDVILVGGTESEVNAAKSAHNDYTFISQDLNAGAGGDYIYLGYKKGSRASVNGGYITDIIVIDAEGTNPPSTVTYSGRTYYLCPYDGGSHFEDVKGNLNSNCGGGWNLYLYYTKANISKQAVSSITVNSTKDGAINCYYTNGNSHETQIDLNRGLSGSSDVYMHLSTTTKTNRPSVDPVMASGLTYNGSAKQLIATGATLASGTMYYRLGTSGSFTSTVADVKATAAGSYTVYYYAGANSYSNQSDTHSATVSIAKSPNNGVTVSCADVVDGNAPAPQLSGNLSTGAVTYQYSTTQNGTYTTTVPTDFGKYWVKATIAADDNCYAYTTAAVSFWILSDANDLWNIKGGANGTVDHPIVISTPSQLDLLAKKVNGTDGYTANNYSGKYFELGADITYNGTENNYTPIGSNGTEFGGHFDGKGHTVSGININLPSNNYIGLFCKAIESTTIQNLTLDNSRIAGYSYCGGIVGYNSGGTVDNCHVTSSVTILAPNSAAEYHGGIVGRNGSGIVRGCTSAATLKYDKTSHSYYGGIAGYNHTSGTIRDCLVYGGSVSGTFRVGAVVGYNSGTLTNNHYTGVMLNGSEAGLNAGVGGDGSQDGTSYICAIIPYEGVTLSIPSVSATTEYPYNGLKIYSTGMSYNGQYYNYIAYADANISGDVTFTATYSGDVPEDYAHSGFGYTSSADNTNVEMNWAATDGSATCTLHTNVATKYYIAPTFRYAIWGDGDGTQGNPYIITTVRGMNELATKVNSGEGDLGGKYFELGADITYDGTENNYTAIGTTSHNFSANFDGKGHTISGININTGSDCQGIFGYAAYCTIQNLTLASSTIITGGNSGGIFGWGDGVTVSNCHVTNTVTLHATGIDLGGIGGFAMYNSTIKGCTSAATLSFKWNYDNGGIMGDINGGTLKDCLYLGPKFDTTSNGAILGCITQNDPTITNSYHTAYGMKATRHSDAYNTNFAIATGTKPDGFGDATATYGTSTYTGITAYGTNGLEYDGKYYWYDADIVTLEDNASNATVIVDNNGQTRNVVLNGRTLYKDGKWNTLCLPFDVVISGSVLDGAVAKTLTSTDFAGGTLTLNFGEAVSTIEAGKPYIIKWESGENIVSPVFENVTISNSTNNAESTYADFTGSYSPTTISGEDKTKLYLGADNKLYYPNAAMTIGACRGYFQLKNGLIAGEPKSVGAKGISQFVLDFGDENSEATGIRPNPNPSLNGGEWYDLSGRRLSGKPATPGLYIHNGNKIVIK